ncbi:Uncharacterised protein [Mycobacteroides abscessus subsp. abscessus]|nr:Uncharacterised protein [Mycobacteroides abscessus subsp. abscessus]
MTAFWGEDWRRQITIVTTGTDEEFRALAGGRQEFAAATTVDRIVFAPGAAAMGPGALRIVLRHELFHYASRPVTAADAPWCLTEGVAEPTWRCCRPMPTSRSPARRCRWPMTAPGGSPGSSVPGSVIRCCAGCIWPPAAPGIPISTPR